MSIHVILRPCLSRESLGTQSPQTVSSPITITSLVPSRPSVFSLPLEAGEKRKRKEAGTAGYEATLSLYRSSLVQREGQTQYGMEWKQQSRHESTKTLTLKFHIDPL